jgi:hypothetical protein
VLAEEEEEGRDNNRKAAREEIEKNPKLKLSLFSS